jgi:hypothetical protein
VGHTRGALGGARRCCTEGRDCAGHGIEFFTVNPQSDKHPACDAVIKAHSRLDKIAGGLYLLGAVSTIFGASIFSRLTDLDLMKVSVAKLQTMQENNGKILERIGDHILKVKP